MTRKTSKMELKLQMLAFVLTFCTLICRVAANGMGLTFELPGRKSFCFGERYDGPSEYILEYSVLDGGKIDVRVKSPNGKILYKQDQVKGGEFNFESSRGDYSFCFSNEFSTFGRKRIFFELRPVELDSLAGEAGVAKPFVRTALENSCDETHGYLTDVMKFQRMYKLTESVGRYLAEKLNKNLSWWAITQTSMVLITGLGQSFILKRFFTDKPQDAVIKEET